MTGRIDETLVKLTKQMISAGVQKIAFICAAQCYVEMCCD